MEGYLLKWTNYIRGWQQRWFVLKDGVLSYYNNQNDSINGDCKRSFKISMFEIIVNKSDSSRVDLILPNEQYLYLKATDIKERQKWLVALASQKATFPLNNLPQMITGASSSATGDLDSSDPKMPNMTGIFDSTHLLKIKQSELRFYCDLLTQQTHEVKNLLLNVASPSSPSANASAVVVKVGGETGNEKRNGDSSPKASSSSGGGTTSPSLDIIKNSEIKSAEGLSGGYVSASSSFKSLTPTSTGHHSSSSDSEMTTAASTSSRQQSLDGGGATKSAVAAAAAANSSNSSNNGPSDREEDAAAVVAVNAADSTTSTLNSSTNTVVDERPASTGPRSIAVDEDFIKKLDDVSSNINMTCDMLMQIIRNLILLSNTSTNVGPEALKSLLASVAAEGGPTRDGESTATGAVTASATTPKTPKSPIDPFKSDLEQYKYHLYHPMYMNNQLNQYNTKNLPVSSGGGGGSASRGGHLYDFSQLHQQQQHHHTNQSPHPLPASTTSTITTNTSTITTTALTVSSISESFSPTYSSSFERTPSPSRLSLSSDTTIYPFMSASESTTSSSFSTARTNNNNNNNYNNMKRKTSSPQSSTDQSPRHQSASSSNNNNNVNFNMNFKQRTSTRLVKSNSGGGGGSGNSDGSGVGYSGRNGRNSTSMLPMHNNHNKNNSNNNHSHHRIVPSVHMINYHSMMIMNGETGSIRLNNLRNCQIESIKETALVSSQRHVVDSNNSSNKTTTTTVTPQPSKSSTLPPSNQQQQKLHSHSDTQSIKSLEVDRENLKGNQKEPHIDQESPLNDENKENMITAESVTSGQFQTITIIAESRESIDVEADSQSIDTIDEKSFPTFLDLFQHKFFELELKQDKGVPTENFLNCCSDIFSLFDCFGSTTFLPVKIDVYGNINKLRTKYSVNPNKYHTLQAIVKDEIDLKQTTVRNSATDALMWLMRAIWFMREFMRQFMKSYDPDVNECVYVSYQVTLRAHHNWVVRSLFSLAMRSLPTKDEFLKSLALNPQDYLDNKESFQSKIVSEMKTATEGIDRVIYVVRDFYMQHGLEV